MEILLGIGAIILLILPFKVANVLEEKIALKFNAYPSGGLMHLVSYVGAVAFILAFIRESTYYLLLPIFLITIGLNIAWVMLKHKVPAAYGVPFAICLTLTALLGIFWKIAKMAFNSNFAGDTRTVNANSIRAKNRSIELQRQGVSVEASCAQANQEDMNAQLNSKKYSNPQGDGPL